MLISGDDVRAQLLPAKALSIFLASQLLWQYEEKLFFRPEMNCEGS